MLFFIPWSITKFEKIYKNKNEKFYLIPEYLFKIIPKNLKVFNINGTIHKWTGKEKTNYIYLIKIKFFKDLEMKTIKYKEKKNV